MGFLVIVSASLDSSADSEPESDDELESEELESEDFVDLTVFGAVAFCTFCWTVAAEASESESEEEEELSLDSFDLDFAATALGFDLEGLGFCSASLSDESEEDDDEGGLLVAEAFRGFCAVLLGDFGALDSDEVESELVSSESLSLSEDESCLSSVCAFFHSLMISSSWGPSISISSFNITTSLTAFFRAAAALTWDCFVRNEWMRVYVATRFVSPILKISVTS